MSKDVNIHVKTEGTRQVQQDLQGVSQDVNKVGDNVEQMGSRSSRALEWLGNGITSLAGPMGFAALIGVVSSVAGKISQFFNDFKNRCDESVGKLQNLRKGFEDVFEAMDAFDEKSRKGVTAGTIDLLKRTSVSQEVGLPVISQYTRQFKGLVESGQLSPEQYQQGLEGMLGYAARHGKAATPELITLMSGWGMATPEQQGAFRRQIGAVSKVSGLDESNIIDALGKAAPSAKAMGWKPDEVLNYIGTIAAGEVGRKQLTLPSATLEALVNPQTANLKDYRITARQAENPAQLLGLLAVKQKTMDEKSFSRMLRDIYGAEGAIGVSKLLKSPGGAATPQTAAAEMAEELTSRETRERQQALTDAIKTELWTRSDSLFYKKQIRQIGAEERDSLLIEHPYMQTLREKFNPAYAFGIIPGMIANKLKPEGLYNEDAAFVKWLSGPSDEEKQDILSKTKAPFGNMMPDAIRLRKYYQGLTPQQQYEGLTGNAPGSVINNDFHTEHNINYFPPYNSGGPRVSRDFK